MSKPKNMTAEQEAAWKEKQRAYFKARRPKKNMRQREKYSADPAYREKMKKKSAAYLAADEERQARNLYRAKAYYIANRDEVIAKEGKRQREKREYTHFMKRLEAGEDVYGLESN